MKKAILLDWDGVLCDSVSLYYDLYAEACRRYGKTLPIKDVPGFRDWYNPRWEQNYYQMGFQEQEFQEVLKWSETYLDYAKAALFPGVEDTLKSLAREYPLAVVSTTPSFMIRQRMGPELSELFAVMTGGEDGCSDKMEKMKVTLLKLGVEKGVMVGDTPLDITCAKAYGLKTVGCTYGWVNPMRLAESEPDRLVNSPHELEEAIRSVL